MPDYEALKARHQIKEAIGSFEFEGETWHYRVPRSLGIYEKVAARGPEFTEQTKKNPDLKAYHHLTDLEFFNANLVRGFIVKGADDPTLLFGDSQVLDMAATWGSYLSRLADLLASKLNPIIFGETQALEMAKNASGATLSGTDTSGSPAKEPLEESTLPDGASESG